MSDEHPHDTDSGLAIGGLPSLEQIGASLNTKAAAPKPTQAPAPTTPPVVKPATAAPLPPPTMGPPPVMEEKPAVEETVENPSLQQPGVPPELPPVLSELPSLPVDAQPPAKPHDPGQIPVSPPPPAGEPPRAAPSPPPRATGSAPPAAPPQPAAPPPRPAFRISRKHAVIGLAVVGAGLMGWIGFNLITDLRAWDQAQALWRDTQQLRAVGDFSAIQPKAEQIQKTLPQVRWLKGSEKNKLAADLKTLLASKEYQAAREGKVLHEGKAMDAATRERLVAFDDLLQRTRGAADSGRWNEAVDLAGQAAGLATDASGIPPEKATEATKIRDTSRAALLRSEGEARLADNNPEAAAAVLENARKIVLDIKDADPAIATAIDLALAKARAASASTRGKEAFARRDWPKAVSEFEAALAAHPESDPEAKAFRAGIQEKLLPARVGQLLDQARQADLGPALDLLDKAAGIAASEPELFEETEFSSSRIAEERLRLAVKGHVLAAETAEAQKAHPEAIGQLRDALKAIEASRVGRGEEFQKIRQGLERRLNAIEDQVDLAEKTQYLRENAVEIFKQNHALAKTAILSNPQVSLLGRSTGRVLFNLKATGKSSSGTLNLELNYEFDEATGRWGVASGKR